MKYLFTYSIIILSMSSCEKNTTISNANNSTRTPKVIDTISSIVSNDSTNWLDIDDANDQIYSYLESIMLSSIPQIKSIQIDAAALRSYLDDTSIVAMKWMFAHTATIMSTYAVVENQGLNIDGMTAILVGINNNGDYVFKNDDYVLNRMIKCPDNCITTGNAANDLLFKSP